MGLPEECPLCRAGRKKQKVVTPHVYGDKEHTRAFYHCLDCDIRYQHPAPTPEQEATFYAAEFEEFMQSRSGPSGGWQGAECHIHANETTQIRRMKYLMPHIPPSADILEVGCSSGFMLFPFSEAGHDCIGVEPSGVFREYVKHRGLSVYQSLDQLQQLNPELKFDVILHFFVMEHIAQPWTFIESQLALLKPGGKIIFEIPNVNDPLHSVYDVPSFERFYWSLAHPWYFSESSLRYLLGRIGRPYEILLDQRYDLSNHMVWARDGRPGGMGRFTAILGHELEENYKKALIRIGKCDTLIGIISTV